MLILPAHIARELRGLLEDAYPREGCGLLIGRWMERSEGMGFDAGGRRVLEIATIHPARNVHSENPFHRYVAPREDYAAAETRAVELRAARHEHAAGRLEVVGVYHGHPDSPAVPSSIDAEYAFPGWVYVIVELREGHAVETAAWLRAEPGTGDGDGGGDAWVRMEIVGADSDVGSDAGTDAGADPGVGGSETLSSDARSR